MKLMISYVKYVIKPKKKLTTVQVKKISSSIPDDYKEYSNAYLLCQAVKKGTKDKQIQEASISQLSIFPKQFSAQKVERLWLASISHASGVLSQSFKGLINLSNHFLTRL